VLSANGLQISEGTNSAGIVRLDLGFCLCAVSCCFFALIFSTLENNLKISLKKFAQSKYVLYICWVIKKQTQ